VVFCASFSGSDARAEGKRRKGHHHYHHKRIHAPPKVRYTHYYIIYKYEHHEEVNVKFTVPNNSITVCAANISDFLCYTNTNLICLTNGTLMCVSDINLIRSCGTDLPLGIFGTENCIPEDKWIQVKQLMIIVHHVFYM